MTEPLISLRHLSKFFSVDTNLLGRTTSVLKAVDDLSLDIYPGETFGLVGESGCGKTTVGKMLVNLYEPTAGEIWYQGQDLTKLQAEGSAARYRRDIQLIFQDPYSSLNPRMTVGDIIAEPIRVNKLLPANKVDDRVGYLLNCVGLSANCRNRYPHEFSGGQRQRIGIARALAMEPKLIVCDEPVSALDVSIQAQVLNLLSDLCERVRPDLPVHRPRPERGQARQRPGRRHVPRPPGRGGAEARALPQPAAPLHEGAALGDPGHEPGAAQGAHPARGQRRQPDRPGARAAGSPAAATRRAAAPAAPATPRCRSSSRSRRATSCRATSSTPTERDEPMSESLIRRAAFGVGVAAVALCVVLAAPSSVIATTSVPSAAQTGLGTVVIDAGHQAHADLRSEPIGPGSSQTKPRVDERHRGCGHPRAGEPDQPRGRAQAAEDPGSPRASTSSWSARRRTSTSPTRRARRSPTTTTRPCSSGCTATESAPPRSTACSCCARDRTSGPGRSWRRARRRPTWSARPRSRRPEPPTGGPPRAPT